MTPNALSPGADTDPGVAAPPLAWPELLSYRGLLIRYARRRLQDPALAEDVVHDVFLAVLAGSARYGGRAAPGSWLVGILRHKIVDLIRSRGSFDSLEAAVDGDADAEPVCPLPRPDEQAEMRERVADALAGVRALSPMLRQTVALHVLQELPSRDVCQRLAIAENAMHVRLHRARQQVAQGLARRERARCAGLLPA